MLNEAVRQANNENNSVSGNALEVDRRPKILEANSEEINSKEERHRETRNTDPPRAQTCSQIVARNSGTRN